MASPALDDVETVVHLFATVDGPDAPGGHRYLHSVWSGCRRSLGMTADQLTYAPATFPPDLTASASGLLALCQSPAPGRNQALLRRSQDLVVLSVALTCPPGSASRWRDLEQGWDDVAGPLPPELVGTMVVHQAVLASGLTAPPRSVTAGLPGVGADGWQSLMRSDKW